MKKQLIFFVMLLSLAGMFALQSCEEEAGTIKSHFSFTTPKLVSPADGATIDITGTTVTLTWASENKDNDPVDADVYFGQDEDPPLFKADNTALTLSVTVEKGKTYYWRVVMKDANKIPTDGPTWSFTIFEPIGIFVGDFNCDEPAEAYSYDVSFVKATATSLTTDNYWNSGWAATFNLDFTAKTYTMPLTTWGTWSAQESGTIDTTTGTMVGDYTIWHNSAVAETGTHTYTKK